ncbi:MAG: hypothetical protein WCP21_17100 [Armatimonadota bacterium]
MSSGHSANYADVIPMENVAELCPDEVGRFVAAVSAEYPEEAVSDFATALAAIAREYDCGEDETHGDDVRMEWKELTERFEEITGLGLQVGFHDPENGGPYDEVEGAYLAVEGMYELSAAGKPFQGIVERRMWVTFG